MLHFLRNCFSRPTFVGLSKGHVAWLEAKASGSVEWGLHNLENEAGQGIELALTELCQRTSNRTLHFVCGPSLMRHWVQPFAAGVQTLTELKALTQVRSTQIWGGTPTDWRVTADWRAHAPFTCAATPSGWYTTFESAWAKQSHRQIEFTSALGLLFRNHAARLPIAGWLAVLSAGELALIRLRDRLPVSLRSVRQPLTTVVSGSSNLVRWAVDEWRRELMRANESIEHLYWLDLQAPLEISAADRADLVRTGQGVQVNLIHIDLTMRPRSDLQAIPLGLNELSPYEQEACLTAWAACSLVRSSRVGSNA